LKIVKEKYPYIVRFVLSGYVDKEYVLSAIIQGIVSMYLAKPWNIDVIHKCIKRVFEIKEILNQNNLLQLIGSIDKLPGIPALYQDLIQMIDEKKSIPEIVALVEKDIAISVKILHVANSAFYNGGNDNLNSLERAMINLGLNAIKDIVFTVSFANELDLDAKDAIELEKISAHSWKVNYLFTNLFLKLFDKQDFVLWSSAGISHDIGKIIQLLYFPAMYHKIVEAIHKNHSSYYHAEISLGYLGASHSELGGYLLRMWNLSNNNVETATLHHKISDSGSEQLELFNLVDQFVSMNNANCSNEELIELFEETEKFKNFLKKIKQAL
ncbi:MAG: response regulator, partial [Spirochaetes bacterium]|nr:response regulator [Spirochaetota bacterium]